MTDDSPLTYIANADKTISIKDEAGADVRYTLESDLLAVKGRAETAETKLTEADVTHKTAITDMGNQLSDAQSKLAQAEASKTELEGKLAQGTTTAEELAEVKKQLDTANGSVGALTTQVLDARRQLIVTTFGVAAETVKDKTKEQLDAYEEALKAVGTGKGIGPYAVAGGGSGSPTPVKPIDRAKAILADAEAKGHSH